MNRNAFASRVRTDCWSANGKTPMMRSTVFDASMVCSDITRWPVSAASSNLDRFAVAHFADQDHLGRLSQRGA